MKNKAIKYLQIELRSKKVQKIHMKQLKEGKMLIWLKI